MDYRNLTKVLDSFNKERGSFGYNEKNRHSIRHKISPMIKDDDMSKEEMESRFNQDINDGQAKYKQSVEALKAEISHSSWNSTQNNFRRGSAKSAMFLVGDDDEEKITSNRFSSGINIKRELELNRQRKAEEKNSISEQNATLNRLECQHMDYNTSRNDRATRAVIRERKKGAHDADYNTEYETGNTPKVTKERSINENINIIKQHDHYRRGRNVFSIRTTLTSDDDGNCVEQTSIMNDKNTEIMNSNIADVGEYKNSLSQPSGMR